MEVLTVNMQNIGVLAQRETITMKVITVLTLVYLPATFVSVSGRLYFPLCCKSLISPKTFFSTDIVKYQNQGNSSGTDGPQASFSQLAMFRWLQVAVPLTFLTLVLGWLGYKWQERRQKDKLALYALELKAV